MILIRVLLIVLFFSCGKLFGQKFAIYYDFNSKMYSLGDLTTLKLIPNSFDEITYSEETNSYIVKLNKKVGVIDSLGNLSEPIQNDEYYSRDSFIFKKKSSNFQVIDYVSNKKIIDSAFYTVSIIDNHFFAKTYDNKMGVIDQYGKTIIPFEYKSISTFDFKSKNNRLIVSKDGKMGVIDLKNNTIIPFEYFTISSIEDDSGNIKAFSAVKAVNSSNSKSVYNAGIYSENGEILIPFEYNSLSTTKFNDNLIAAFKNNKSGYINWKNEIVIHFVYDAAIIFNYDVASVKKDNQFGVINRDNKLIIPFDNYLQSISFRDNGLSTFIKRGTKYGLINKEGKIVLDPIYGDITYLNNIMRLSLDKKQGIADFNGNVIIPVIYDYINPVFINGGEILTRKSVFFFEFQKDRKFGILNSNNQIVIENKFDLLHREKDYFIIKKDNLYGVMDLNFNIIFEPKFLNIKSNGTTIFTVLDRDDRIYNIDLSGKKYFFTH